MEITELISLVRQTKPLLEDSGRASQVTTKGKSDYVTEVDFAVQAFLKQELKQRYPAIQFMGEEGDSGAIDFKKPVWILDPVDGTTNLLHHFCMSAVSLALVEDGEPVLGIVYQPYTDELFYAERGKGAYLNGEPIQVSRVDSPADSLIIMGPTPYQKERYADMVMRITRRIFVQCQDIRTLGTAALELAYVACGRAEGYYEKVLQPWDFAAGALILQEAGGRICQWDQSSLRYDQACSVLADNGNMGDWLLDALEP